MDHLRVPAAGDRTDVTFSLQHDHLAARRPRPRHVHAAPPRPSLAHPPAADMRVEATCSTRNEKERTDAEGSPHGLPEQVPEPLRVRPRPLRRLRLRPSACRAFAREPTSAPPGGDLTAHPTTAPAREHLKSTTEGRKPCRPWRARRVAAASGLSCCSAAAAVRPHPFVKCEARCPHTVNSLR